MKTRVALLLSVFLSFAANDLLAQIRDIPAAVTTAFKTKYPDARDVSWDDKVTSFQANFKTDDGTYEARFTKDGIWKETERRIELAQLPDAVKNAFDNSKFKDWSLKTVSEVESGSGGKEYRIFVKNKTVKRKYLIYNESGELIREAYKL
jgi:hypothetical protein